MLTKHDGDRMPEKLLQKNSYNEQKLLQHMSARIWCLFPSCIQIYFVWTETHDFTNNKKYKKHEEGEV